MPDRLLVFGASGFLGGRICHAATASGQDVHGTHLQTAASPGPFTWHRCDITNRATVDKLVDDIAPSHIINAAYSQSGPDVFGICATGPATIAAAAEQCGARYAHVSTDLVFDGTLGRPYRESDEPSPLGAYGEAKTHAESAVAEIAPGAIIARTSLIYGKASAPQETLVQRAHDTGEISFFTDEWRTPVHVDDLAGALLRLVRTDVGGRIHLAGTERLNRLEFARLLATAMNLDADSLPGRTQDPAMGPRAADVSLDTTLSASLGITLPGPTERLSNH